MWLESGLSCPPGLASLEASTVFICFVFTCLHQGRSALRFTVTQSLESTFSRPFTASGTFEKIKLHLCILFYFFLMTLLLSLDAFRASFYHFILRFSNNISQHRVISCWIFFSQPFGPSSRMAFSWSPEGISDWEYILTFPTLPLLFTFTLCRNHQVFGCFTFLVRVLSSLVLFFSPIYIKPYIKYICLSVSIVFK